MNTKVVVSLSLIISFLSPEVFAQSKGAEFEGKYLFTHSFNSKVKEYNDVISKCFKLNAKALKALASYDSCGKTHGREVPLQKSIGECMRSDKAAAYFFDSLKDCKEAQKESIDGAST